MSPVITLGPNSHAGCPKCGRRITFFSGENHAFIGEGKNFFVDTILELECPVDGVFETQVGGFFTER